MAIAKDPKESPLDLAKRNVHVAYWTLSAFIVVGLLILVLLGIHFPDKPLEVFLAFLTLVLATLSGVLGVIQIEMAYYQMKK